MPNVVVKTLEAHKVAQHVAPNVEHEPAMHHEGEQHAQYVRDADRHQRPGDRAEPAVDEVARQSPSTRRRSQTRRRC